MRRLFFWLVLFLLCGCQEKEEPRIYNVIHRAKVYLVNQEQGTVTCDDVVYQFQVSSGTGGAVYLEILYPDGSQYYWTREREGDYGCGGWSGNYEPATRGYEPGDVLRDVLGMGPENTAGQRGSGPPRLLAALFLAAVGVFHAVAPRTAWMLRDGWRFQDAEPSDAALDVNRIVGVVLFCAGVMLCLLPAF